MKHYRIQLLSTLAGAFLLLAACSPPSTAVVPTPAESSAINPALRPRYIIAEGIVIPEQKAVLSFVNGGIVEEIFFDEGDTLKKGDLIASLSGYEQINAQVASAELALLDAQEKLNTFLDNESFNKANAELALAQAQLALEDAQDNRARKDLQRASTTTLDGLRADFVLAEDALKEKQEDYQYYKDNKSEEDLARAQSMLLLTEARRAYEKVASNLNYALGLPNIDEIAEAEAKLNLALANVEKAQAELDAMQAGPDPDELAILETAQKAAASNLASAQRSLQDLYLKAPFNGQLVSSNLQLGEYISAGQTAVVVGNLDQWVIETTDLTEMEIVNIKVGDTVSIQLDALPDIESTGTVQRIKLLGENVQGDVTYTVTIIPDETIEGLRWNMTAFMKFYQE
jgi:multidrug efflux pump subunit AcrA (membrane-fusion protein)